MLYITEYKSSIYSSKFDEAVKIADEKVGIQNEEIIVKQWECEPRKLFHDAQSHINEQDNPVFTHEHSSISKSFSTSPNDSLNENSLSQTPTRLQRPAKRLRSNSTSTPTKWKTKAAKQDKVSPSNGIMESTPRNSDIESEDDLPAISMTQTPVKSYSSCEFSNCYRCFLRMIFLV